MTLNREHIVENAKRVLEIEAAQIQRQIDLIDGVFVDIVNAIVRCNGKLIVSGMGKSGIIARKISATFSSYGIQSFFLHPAEAYHGDLGMVGDDDLILFISKSGETDEILKLIPFFQSQGNVIISMTRNRKSSLALNSAHSLEISIDQEACPLQLAPTASTTVALAMGDALAVATMKAFGLEKEQFAQFHPGGSLGRKLLLKVRDQMIQADHVPLVKEDTLAIDAIHAISNGRLGVAVVTGDDQRLLGIITDGDVRRSTLRERENFINMTAGQMMTQSPRVVSADAKILEAEKLMDDSGVHQLIVVDTDGVVLGLLPYRTQLNVNREGFGNDE